MEIEDIANDLNSCSKSQIAEMNSYSKDNNGKDVFGVLPEHTETESDTVDIHDLYTLINGLTDTVWISLANLVNSNEYPTLIIGHKPGKRNTGNPPPP